MCYKSWSRLYKNNQLVLVNGGATIEDIELFKKYVGKDVKIKAAGGVKSIEKAEEFIEKGASRLGTSSIIKIMNNEEVKGY